MKRAIRERIRRQWEENCEMFEDKSTPFVVKITADQCGVQYNDVIDAVMKSPEESEVKS